MTSSLIPSPFFYIFFLHYPACILVKKNIHCNTGVRQCENLYPFLFSIFLNDLEQFFIDLNGCPLELVLEKSLSELNIFIKLFVILYADDTVILAESVEGMQNALDIFQIYSEFWKLEINIAKTKMMIFSKRKMKQNFDFKLQGKNIEVVDIYSYLGLIFKCVMEIF
jgi:hypothetical protein